MAYSGTTSYSGSSSKAMILLYFEQRKKPENLINFKNSHADARSK
jgi:hypothetical protein